VGLPIGPVGGLGEMTKPLRVLLVEDSEDDALLVVSELERSGFAPEYRVVETRSELASALDNDAFDVMVTDYRLPGFDGLQAITMAGERELDIPIIVVSGAIGEDVAVAAMRAGAHDYVMKDNLARLGAAVERELEEAAVREAGRNAEEALRASEARYRAIVEDQTDLVVRWRPDGTRTFVNRAYSVYFDRPRRQLVGSSIFEHLSEADRHQVLDKISSLRPEHPVAVDERRVLKPDGEEAWHEWVDRGVFDTDGELMELQSVGRDITVRRRAAEAERQQLLLVEVLRDTAEALNRTLNLDEVFDRILANLGWVVPHDTSAILFIEEGAARVVRHRGWVEMGIDNVPEVIGLADEEVKALTSMMSDGKPLVIQDTSSEPRWRLGSGRLGWVRSFAAAPLFDEQGVRGVLALFCAQPEHFSPTHMELLEGFASHSSTATRNARLFEAVSRGRRELRELSAQVVDAQEEERRRISRELHDEVGQTLSVMILNADFISSQFGPEVPPRAKERLEDITALARATLDQIRNLSLRLRPTMLDELGLVPTLRWLVERFTERTQMHVDLSTEDYGDIRLGSAEDITLYRAVQEALTNVIRHADASRVKVHLSRSDQSVDLRIEDDGVGFGVDRHGRRGPGKLGLVGMRERVTRLDGSLEITSAPGRGTCLHIRLPYHQEA
jgi:PAS domain S-box-containing protein